MNAEISIEAAAQYANHGFLVFPINAPDKRPLTTHGHLDASEDPEIVTTMFRKAIAEHGNEVGIGFWTGASGVVVIDTDSDDAEHTLRERVGDATLAAALILKTSRGRHYYFAAPEDVPLCPITALCGVSGLDVRAGSSWAILPPSRHASGFTYSWEGRELGEVLRDLTKIVPPMPEALVTMLKEHASRNPLKDLRDTDGQTCIPEGQRNGVLWRAGREARRWGADEPAVTTLIKSMNTERCEAPLAPDEVRSIVRSVMRNDPMHPITPDTSPREKKLRQLDVAYMVGHDPPPVDWIADGLVAREAVTMIHGAAGLGKSMLALALGVAVTRGAPFMGHTTKKGRVLYIDAENGQGEAHRRIRALGLTVEEAELLIYYEAIAADLAADEDELREVALAAAADLIVVDSLATMNRSDEDSSREMTPALQVLQRIAREACAGVLLLHHDRKDRTTLRGSSAIEAVIEVRWHLTKDEERNGARRLTNEKCRLAAESAERWVEVRHTPEGIVVAQIPKPPSNTEAEKWLAVLDVLSDGQPRTYRQIAADSGLASPSGACPGDLSRLLKAKRDEGYLIKVSGGVKLASHLFAGEEGASVMESPPIVLDPLIPLYRGGSEDQSVEAA